MYQKQQMFISAKYLRESTVRPGTENKLDDRGKESGNLFAYAFAHNVGTPIDT